MIIQLFIPFWVSTYFIYYFYTKLKSKFFYFKNNNYTSYNLIFLVLFSGILFTFLYVIVNFIISQYNLININNDNELSISDENKKILNILKY